jgi:predicted metal-dependent peptidase
MDPLDTVLEFLWKNSRFSSYFYQTVRFCTDTSVPTLTLSVWGKRAVLYYNPVFFESLSRDEIAGLLIHEMLHVVFSHNHRVFRHENPYLQNLAQDMVVNAYMEDRKDKFFSLAGGKGNEGARLALPQGLPVVPLEFFRDTGIRDPAWEEVYRWLKTRGPKELQEFNDGLKTLFSNDHVSRPGGASPRQSVEQTPPLPPDDTDRPDMSEDRLFVFRNPDNLPLPTGAHMLEYEAARRGLAQNLLKAVQLSSKDDTALNDRLFKDISAIITRPRNIEISPVVKKIKTVVHRFSQSAEWQPSFDTFNRRFFANGVYSPGRRYVNHKTITVAVDVSASMVTRPETLEKAFGAVEALVKTYRVSLVCLDEALFVPVKKGDHFVSSGSAGSSCIYKKGDWRYIRSGNSGTTFFEPLFNRYMVGRKDALIVITDGQIYDLQVLTPYPRTLWLIPSPSAQTFQPPFGTVVFLEES